MVTYALTNLPSHYQQKITIFAHATNAYHEPFVVSRVFLFVCFFFAYIFGAGVQ